MNDKYNIESQIKEINNIRDKALAIVNQCDKSLYSLKWELLKLEDMETIKK